MKSIFHRQYRILVTITVLFTLLITAFGTVLAIYIYDRSSTIMLEVSEQYFSRVRDKLTMDYLSMHRTFSQTIRILANTDIVTAYPLEERLKYVPIIYSALRKEPKLTALQFGYDNGDYFIVRSLANDYMVKRFNGPDQAAVVVDNILTNSQGIRERHRFWFTENMARIGKEDISKTDYDPRIRPWYQAALSSSEVTGTKPYLFHFIGRMGFTVAYKPTGVPCVIAGDITLISLSEILAGHIFSPRTEILLFEEKNEALLVTAYKDTDKIVMSDNGETKRSLIPDLQKDILTHAYRLQEFRDPFFTLEHQGETWLGSTRKVDFSSHDNFYLSMLSPESDILQDARTMQTQTRAFTFIMVILAIPLTWLLARKISLPLQYLAKISERISRFDFAPGKNFQGSTIKEVDDLGLAMTKMTMTIEQFISLTNSLASEQDFDRLLKRISEETMAIGEAQGAFTYVVRTSVNTLSSGAIHTPFCCYLNDSYLPEYELNGNSALEQLLGEKNPIIGALEHYLPEGNLSEIIPLADPVLVILPAANRQGETVGLLCLIYDKAKFEAEDQSGRLALLQALSGFAAVTLESRQMLRMQKDLLESFIKVLADAIDSKSAYTGGHCKRVPVLAELIAQKAYLSTVPPFDDFNLDESEWETLRIASWLHDCGKVTSPEYVVDKATKLETIYDRIHEIRMRYEVLKRDAHIKLLKEPSTINDTTTLQTKLQQEWQELDEQFAFIAKCNIGGEFLDTDQIERLEQIAKQTWERTISDRLGISWEERQRKERLPEQALPVKETVLADRYDHLISRDEKQIIAKDNPFGFQLDTPEYLYNRGELYNLRTSRGTLTREDRYQINDHIVQTIMMLEKLPFPKHLKAVPEIAGGHHEKLDGNGYPRRLTGDMMSLPAKIMVLADIFEALTAADRPYKNPKNLSEAIEIMFRMVENNHIDPHLFKLFLSSGAYLEYAEKYMQPDQIDHVNVDSILKSL